MGKKVLVLGTGAQGTTVAKRLDLEPNVDKIICADYDEAAAYAKNAKDAEALVHTRRENALNQGISLESTEAQKYAAEQGVLGNYWYGYPAARKRSGTDHSHKSKGTSCSSR